MGPSKRLDAKHWLQSEISALVGAYKSQRALWDLLHPDYKNKSKRQAIIAEIAVFFETNPKEVVRKIHNLRSQLALEIKKVNAKLLEEPGLPYKSPWTFFEPLQFLVDGNCENEESFSSVTELLRAEAAEASRKQCVKKKRRVRKMRLGRFKWTGTAMLAAMKAVVHGGMLPSRAERQFGVPRETLCRYIKKENQPGFEIGKIKIEAEDVIRVEQSPKTITVFIPQNTTKRKSCNEGSQETEERSMKNARVYTQSILPKGGLPSPSNKPESHPADLGGGGGGGVTGGYASLGGDAISTFFASMAATVRALPLPLQVRVKREVLETVTQAEMEQTEIFGS